jgi:signal peptidase II
MTDKLFWNGSLDYLRFKGLFTFDLKDVYITDFEVILIAMIVFNYKNLSKIDDKGY